MRQNRKSGISSHLVRLMIANWALGWAVGFACAGAVLVSNVGGIREIMMRSDVMLQGLALLFGGFGFTFGGVVCATAIMLLPTDEDSWNHRGGRRAPILLPAYALAKVRAARP
ncbi:hypothetical protein K9U39_00250 [Rhodoblastus acidophilus]|jgi:hypothetical protein|uniref:Uncharacterized protein n=1 Tax=Candidatus Rhodoblastus alkanivorans TaxID=2954117 RepID=A0ABS9Z340_9HYPH|nr:hypothetical protein [Candidatus Rhodoblastus alkanivorans]MCI4677355.1 hypothetical protein [Candidatus Rhodoblastus alkanivorans]MCI4682090.1 hypothetical protein [Candidatus Rhodoblastus alkanivorans]MDI4639392.1 hypothetical protein [Rhodoblastus acidophilus]